MIEISINYNPYFMKTILEINGRNILNESNYTKFRKYLEAELPLQTWIDPIPHDEWLGLIEELLQESGEGRLKIHFKGRKIDFEDLERSLFAQNNDRENKINIEYSKDYYLSDQALSSNIDFVVKEMLSTRFKKLVNKSESPYLKEKYGKLQNTYSQAKSKEFKIIFAGLYSSGKSTLINALIGKEILPTSDETCTSKVFKIKHEKNVKYAKLRCVDENQKLLLPEMSFDNESDLNEKFMEICPIGEPSKPPEIDEIQISTDLSHLYPGGFEDKFNIIIVDTPGTNSGEGNDDSQVEKHIDITLEAIQAKEKEMVLLIVDGQDYQDESIRVLLDAIEETAKEDEGGFNDRFMFVMNKCDNKKYKNQENILSTIDEFADYLSTKKDKNGDKRMISPRIFPVCAIGAMAVKLGCTTEESVDTQEKENLYQNYENYRANCKRRFKAENFHFEKVCSTSEHSKDIFEQEILKSVKNNDEAKEILIHTGIPSIEKSVQEYIERYAYPIKVKELLSTFESILSEIRGMNTVYTKQMDDAIKTIGNMEEKKKQEQKKRKEKEERKKIFEKAHNEVNRINEEISKINFNPKVINDLKAVGYNKIFSNSIIVNITEKSKLNTLSEAEELIRKMAEIVKIGTIEIESEFEKIIKENNDRAKEIHSKLKSALQELEKEGIFKIDGFDFKETVAYKEYLKIDSVDDLRKKIAIEKKTVAKRNPIKNEEYEWYQVIKKTQQMFAPDTISQEVTDYNISFLKDKVYGLKIGFDRLCDKMREKCLEDIVELKNSVTTRLNSIIELVEVIEKELIEKSQEIDELLKDKEEFEKIKQELKEDVEWLSGIIQSLQIIL